MRASRFGSVALDGVPGGCAEMSGVETDMFLVLKALRLDDEKFFLKLSGAEATLLTIRGGDGAVVPLKPSPS